MLSAHQVFGTGGGGEGGGGGSFRVDIDNSAIRYYSGISFNLIYLFIFILDI